MKEDVALLLWLWIGFSLTFVLLVWIRTLDGGLVAKSGEMPTSAPSPNRLMVIRIVMSILGLSGALGSAAMIGAQGGVSIGIAGFFWTGVGVGVCLDRALFRA
jgi:hypothetical protein